MLQAVHKILALIIALAVLISSMSFTVEKHVCMGEVTDTSFFTDVDSCGMLMEKETCTIDDFSGIKIQKEKCCNTIHQLIPGNQNQQQALDHLELSQMQFILAYTYSYLNLFENQDEETCFLVYAPPLVDKDINVLYQTFLI